MRGGLAQTWLKRGVQTNVPEVGDTYPLTVQRQDKAGVPQWGVFSAVTGGFLHGLHDTREEAESILNEVVARAGRFK